MMTKFEGQLSKFTNVVKGWQYRWFVLDTSSMVLEYYLLEEKDGKCRGRQEMEGALVMPSEEDSHTFCINFSSGEVYKVRAAEARGQNYSAAELGLQLAAAAGMPTRRENGIYSAELGLRVGSELGLK